MSKDNGESSFGVFSGKGVGICPCQQPSQPREVFELTCVADSGVMDLDANLVSLGRSNLNIFNGEGLSGIPRNRRLKISVGTWTRESMLATLTLQLMV